MPRNLFIRNLLEMHHGNLQHARDRRLARLHWLDQIKTLAEDGQIALCSWSRDCDMCEGTTRTVMPADAKLIDERMDRDYAGAEGPMNHWLQRVSAPYEGYFRDRALEAYEDGHPHVIYLD